MMEEKRMRYMLLMALLMVLNIGVAQTMDGVGAENDVRTPAVEKTTMLSVGRVNRLDTYLSPLNYKGVDARFLSTVLREGKGLWDMQFAHDGGLDYTHNLADNGNTIGGHYDFAFSMMHRWQLMDNKLTLRAGGMTELYVGFGYNMRNSANNPAQGYASLHVGGAGMATYKTPLKIRKRPITVSYEARLPIVGIMFSPNYGQSYYELFGRKEFDNNVVFNTIATPSFRQQLSVDIPLWKKAAVRIGYLNDIRQATPNNLKQHLYTHAVCFGIHKVR